MNWPFFPFRHGALSGTGISRSPRHILAAVTLFLDLQRRFPAFLHGHDLPAVHSGARPHIDQIIGGADGILVMFDDHDGIAQIPQAAAGFPASRWLSRWCSPMEGSSSTYRHARQSRADLRGQADTLALAAGQRPRGAGSSDR
jgi:hypothetical protein